MSPGDEFVQVFSYPVKAIERFKVYDLLCYFGLAHHSLKLVPLCLQFIHVLPTEFSFQKIIYTFSRYETKCSEGASVKLNL